MCVLVMNEPSPCLKEGAQPPQLGHQRETQLLKAEGPVQSLRFHIVSSCISQEITRWNLERAKKKKRGRAPMVHALEF
jgi:hypothetical protein